MEENISIDLSILKDPRRSWGNIRHRFMDIVHITITCCLCPIDDWEDMELFARENEQWFSSFLDLPGGIPTWHTLCRVISAIDPVQFQKCFFDWSDSLCDKVKGRIINIDGKTSRGGHDKDTAGLHLLNAWCSENGLCLGQLKTAEKSNEITVIPEILDIIDIKDAVITIDAMGTQKAIANKIVEEKGDYVLAVKGNQPWLFECVKNRFDESLRDNFRDEPHSYHETFDCDHGRIERRKYWLLENIDWFDEKHLWPGMNSVGMTIREITENDKTTVSKAYHISSLDPQKQSAGKYAQAVRSHWEIENKLHWSLDVIYKEDANRSRRDNAVQNMSLIRKMTMNILKKETSINKSQRKKRFLALIDAEYREKLLNIAVK